MKLESLLVCTLFMFVGPALILLNQYILKSLNFPYPMFLSGLGVAASGFVAQILVKTGFVVLQRKEAVEGVSELLLLFIFIVAIFAHYYLRRLIIECFFNIIL